MIRIRIVTLVIAASVFAVGCADHPPPPPTCASLGCPGPTLLCNRDGQCACQAQTCSAAGSDADADIDAGVR